ncbi:phage tail protein, partial [Cereibacter sphaeroides]
SLAACDWTQVADAPVDRAAWAAYRQTLRDVPEQAGFPAGIAWPEPPAA